MRGRTARVLVVAALALLCGATSASADWNGDEKGDVLAIDANGALLQYRGTGAGGFQAGTGEAIGSGWGSFTALLATEFSGDKRPDLLARTSDGLLLMYRGNGRGGFVTGTGESLGGGWGGFTALLAPGDFNGDGKSDLLAVQSDGTMLLYRGNGDSGFIGGGVAIGSGWGGFTALLAPGDWNGDGKADVLARASDGTLYLYRGNGTGGWITGTAEPIGAGWQNFTALTARGDFSGDGYPDILARQSDGALIMYRGNGTGGFIAPYPAVGSGWQSLTYITLVGQGRPAPPPPPPPPPTPLPDGKLTLNAGDHCTPPGGRLHVQLKIRKRKGNKRPRVVRVVFFVRHGPRKVDRKKPYEVRLRLRRPAGSKGRVYARVFFKRKGTKKLRHKTVARRYVMCG
jgi:FG-GAP-like repeat/Tachylectin